MTGVTLPAGTTGATGALGPGPAGAATGVTGTAGFGGVDGPASAGDPVQDREARRAATRAGKRIAPFNAQLAPAVSPLDPQQDRRPRRRGTAPTRR
ncbi:MAG: hypothetical protein E6J91_20380 [Deltaproteobacteria bacterium]|nr:MAG: hypothetical protein E6J91_20380 [Deltaproteobacteria bacterium]